MTIAIIPARMASTRFPGKPMAPIHGIPMIGHCFYRSKMSNCLDAVYIATCDEEIREYALSIGAMCIMTASTHERASDRIAEAMLTIENESGVQHETIVLVQGDEPMLHPEMIDLTVKALEEDPNLLVVNGMAEIATLKEFEDPNEIKVVFDRNLDAIYFSREPIPSKTKWDGKLSMWKQVCIIPFRRNYLLEFNDTLQTPLEKIESIDMLRVIESGGTVRMVKMPNHTVSVDTQEDLDMVSQLMKSDSLIGRYDI
ncbi:3-deoxy-manno-octulosonate cytidylyltransferase [Rhodospirillales bacterium]|nr:3-deoxy-manno-octulosonate cytidylyltransferase [Rhodospirillales bacterium]